MLVLKKINVIKIAVTTINCVQNNLYQKAQLSLKKPTVPPTSEAQPPISSHGEKTICQKSDSSMNAMLTKRCFENYNER